MTSQSINKFHLLNKSSFTEDKVKAQTHGHGKHSYGKNV